MSVYAFILLLICMYPPPHMYSSTATQDIYAVNAIRFHKPYGTFSTAGSDGTFNFLDKVMNPTS